MRSLLKQLPDFPIVRVKTTLNTQVMKIDDLRWINLSKLLAEYVVYRSYEGTSEDLFFP